MVTIKLNLEKFLNDAFKKYKSFFNNMGAAQVHFSRGPKQCKTTCEFINMHGADPLGNEVTFLLPCW